MQTNVELIRVNTRAFFVPSNSHFLIVVVNDAAKSGLDATDYFILAQKFIIISQLQPSVGKFLSDKGQVVSLLNL